MYKYQIKVQFSIVQFDIMIKNTVLFSNFFLFKKGWQNRLIGADFGLKNRRPLLSQREGEYSAFVIVCVLSPFLGSA